ncbi:MAG: M48 family metalloprotease [Chitinophagaceae bacterium]|nr:M48 family metalloprotease [Chitinophagaceae bacterium]
MFKSFCFFALLLILFYSVQATNISSLSLRYLRAETKLTVPAIAYSDGAEEIIQIILKTIGLEASFEVKKANVPNASAIFYHGKRYILYNPAFIAAMNKAAGTPWASVAVLAHEMGHHLNGHTLDGKGSLPAIELEADEFSGYVLRKMGASLYDAQLAMRIIATARATSTHPARDDRLMAIADGWKRADDTLKTSIMARETSPEAKRSSLPFGLSEDYISYDVYFTFDPHARYHVTTSHNLVKLFNNRIHVLGKVWTTGKSSYPLAFQTGSEDFLLISNQWKIINKNGTVVGYVRPRK